MYHLLIVLFVCGHSCVQCSISQKHSSFSHKNIATEEAVNNRKNQFYSSEQLCAQQSCLKQRIWTIFIDVNYGLKQTLQGQIKISIKVLMRGKQNLETKNLVGVS